MTSVVVGVVLLFFVLVFVSEDVTGGTAGDCFGIDFGASIVLVLARLL